MRRAGWKNWSRRDQRSGHEIGVCHRDYNFGRGRELVSNGIDQVVYMISTNPGEPLRQLDHIASGGELSRVMLALKVSVETDTAIASAKEVWRACPRPRRELEVPIISTAHAGLRRNRYRHWRSRSRSRGQKLKMLAAPIKCSALPPAADRHLRRPSLRDRKEGLGRPYPHQHSSGQGDERTRK